MKEHCSLSLSLSLSPAPPHSLSRPRGAEGSTEMDSEHDTESPLRIPSISSPTWCALLLRRKLYCSMPLGSIKSWVTGGGLPARRRRSPCPRIRQPHSSHARCLFLSSGVVERSLAHSILRPFRAGLSATIEKMFVSFLGTLLSMGNGRKGQIRSSGTLQWLPPHSSIRSGSVVTEELWIGPWSHHALARKTNCLELIAYREGGAQNKVLESLAEPWRLACCVQQAGSWANCASNRGE